METWHGLTKQLAINGHKPVDGNKSPFVATTDRTNRIATEYFNIVFFSFFFFESMKKIKIIYLMIFIITTTQIMNFK